MLKFKNKKFLLTVALTTIFVITGIAILHGIQSGNKPKNSTQNTITQDVNEQQTDQSHPTKNEDEKPEEVDNTNVDNNSSGASITSPQPTPSKNNNSSISTPVQSSKPKEETPTIKEENPVKTTPEQTIPEVKPVPEQPQVIECAYKRLYGDKTPEELASSSPMVEFYYEQYQDTLKTYESYVKMYSNSTSPEFTYKITQAEFAKDKAYALYERELTSEVSRYSDMYAECN